MGVDSVGYQHLGTTWTPQSFNPAMCVPLQQIYIRYFDERAKIGVAGLDSMWRAVERLSGIPPSAFTDEVIADYIERSRKVRSDATIGKHLRFLRAVLRWGAARTMCPEPPQWPCLRTLSKPQAKRWFDARELRMLFESLAWFCPAEDPASHWYPDMLRILIATAQRIRSVLRLRWEHIHKGYADFTLACRPGPARTKGAAIIPIEGNYLGKVLTALRARERGPFVLHREDGGRISYEQARRQFAKHMQGVNLAGEKYTLHSLRHAVAANLLRQGVDLLEVSKLLGHRSSQTTELVYGHLCRDYLKRAADSAAGLIGEGAS